MDGRTMGPTRLGGILLILGIAIVESLSPLQLISENKTPFLNIGLEGAVTQADWDKATRNDLDNPTFTHPTLGGGTNVTGKHMVTINERLIFAFKGIRYGVGPVGDNSDLRFKPSRDPERYWGENELDATVMGDKCSQKAMLGDVPSGSDDCLFLNVFTPKHPDEISEPLPVMFFIHGGGFIAGDTSLYLPTKLLDEDVILVTIQYRLGTQGFFALLNDNAPGNPGLYDQQLALQWVQDHIEGFGGDPAKVTIFGESAGGVSVNYHLILPSSGGLFQGVIGESGSTMEHWSIDFDPIESAELIAELHDCPTDSRDAIYECMMSKTGDELAMVMAKYSSEDRKNGGMGFRGASPVNQATEDADFTNFNASIIVEKNPEQYFIDGDINDVPLMQGANKNEGSFVLGIMYLQYLLQHPEYFYNETWMRDEMLGVLMHAFGIDDQTNGIAESLEDAYFGGADMADFNNSAIGAIDLVGVMFLKAGAWQTSKLHAKHSTSDTFVYSFDFNSDDTMFRWLFMGHSEMPFDTGVTHSDELLYLFSFPGVLEGQQIVVKDRMVKLWTNFAKYGNPTPDEDKSYEALNIPKWKPLKPDAHHYMLMQDEFTVEDEYPDRWHINLEEHSDPSLTTPSPPTSPPGPSWADYNDVVKDRDTFEAVMITFVVLTALSILAAVGIFMKNRR